VEQPADDAGHEQQRDEDGDQRKGDGDDGKADLAGAFERRRKGWPAGLEVAHDVFDHDDRIVNDEADGDAQPHERKVVETVAEQQHGAERGDDGERHRYARYRRRPRLAQEREDDQYHQDNGNQQGIAHVGYRRADILRPVAEQIDVHRGGDRFL
jgi:hypothetical protein